MNTTDIVEQGYRSADQSLRSEGDVPFVTPFGDGGSSSTLTEGGFTTGSSGLTRTVAIQISSQKIQVFREGEKVADITPVMKAGSKFAAVAAMTPEMLYVLAGNQRRAIKKWIEEGLAPGDEMRASFPEFPRVKIVAGAIGGASAAASDAVRGRLEESKSGQLLLASGQMLGKLGTVVRKFMVYLLIFIVAIATGIATRAALWQKRYVVTKLQDGSSLTSTDAEARVVSAVFSKDAVDSPQYEIMLKPAKSGGGGSSIFSQGKRWDIPGVSIIGTPRVIRGWTRPQIITSAEMTVTYSMPLDLSLAEQSKFEMVVWLAATLDFVRDKWIAADLWRFMSLRGLGPSAVAGVFAALRQFKKEDFVDVVRNVWKGPPTQTPAQVRRGHRGKKLVEARELESLSIRPSVDDQPRGPREGRFVGDSRSRHVYAAHREGGQPGGVSSAEKPRVSERRGSSPASLSSEAGGSSEGKRVEEIPLAQIGIE
jgi:hypothetical protein